MNLLIATSNTHKLKEIRQILTPFNINILGSKDVGGIPDVIEDGDTFEANAQKKASEIAITKKMFCLADDSGLVVEALNGEPGVLSARYAGDHGDDKANRLKLLEKLNGQSNRHAYFVCVIAISDPNGNILDTFRGEVHGEIIHEEKGLNGFGYDSIFVPQGYHLTFAELPQEIKNQLSHRSHALHAMVKKDIINIIFNKKV